MELGPVQKRCWVSALMEHGWRLVSVTAESTAMTRATACLAELCLWDSSQAFRAPGWQRWAVLLGALILPAIKMTQQEGGNAVAFVAK